MGLLVPAPVEGFACETVLSTCKEHATDHTAPVTLLSQGLGCPSNAWSQN